MCNVDIVIIRIIALVIAAIVGISIRNGIKNNYRGHDIQERAKYIRDYKWIHHHNCCHKGSGSFCESCFAYDECWEDCKTRAKNEIDAWEDRNNDRLPENSV